MSATEYGPVATRMLFENDSVRVWEMDLKPGDICGTHHHQLDYVLFILSGARIGVESPGRKPQELVAHERAVYLVPAGGIESAHNIGNSRFFEALFEIKRPPRVAGAKYGYAGIEALCGKEPEPGSITFVDTDRVRVRETTLAPGGETPAFRYANDAAVYVAEGGPVKIVEPGAGGGEQARSENLRPGAVEWVPRGTVRKLVNVGTGRFRQVSVELK
jgi:quercetin dioxygenase-like cupin family protein